MNDSGTVERVKEPAKWLPIETAPKDGTDIIVGFDFATVWVVHLAWWRSVEDWMKEVGNWSEDDVGWWSYTRGSVTQEKLDGYRAPTHWMPCPPIPDDKDSHRYLSGTGATPPPHDKIESAKE